MHACKYTCTCNIATGVILIKSTIVTVTSNAQRREGLEILDDTTPANCYVGSNQCLGSPIVGTVGICCDNTVDPIAFSYQTDSEGCQACPIGLFL